MRDLPEIVSRHDLEFYWIYKDEERGPKAIVARYPDPRRTAKKRFHQYRIDNDGKWVEGAPTPLPLYGVDTLPKSHSEEKVYIFEGERCATAAHHLELAAITSMMGSGRAADADWAILAKYRHINEFVLVPDNDIPGHKYIEIVFREIRKACPFSKISVCPLPSKDKGDDLIDWIQANFLSMCKWDGFTSIAKPHSEHIKREFLAYVNQNLSDAEKYFEENEVEGITFEYPHEPIRETLIPVLPCPMDTLPVEVVNWINGFSMQMQISEDYLVAPFFVNIGSLIGRKRCLRVRQGTSWIEFPNAWGMLVGRSAMMKSPAMNAVINPLRILADRMFKKYKTAMKQYQGDLEAWKIRKKASEEVYKRNFKAVIEGTSEDLKEEVKFHVEDMPEEPRERRYITQDATTAKLGELLLENPQGLLIHRDELSGWLKSFEKSGQENDRHFFLESWSGKQDFDVDRIGRGTLHIPALCFSIFGSIQPGPLSQYVRSTIQGGGDDDGFIQRFQFMVWPDPKETWELVSGISIADLELPIQKVFDCLDSLTFCSDGSPEILIFAEDSQKLFDEWQAEFERKIRSGT